MHLTFVSPSVYFGLTTATMVVLYFLCMNHLYPGIYNPKNTGLGPLKDYILYKLSKDTLINIIIKIYLIFYYSMSFWIFHTYVGGALLVISFSVMFYVPIELLPFWFQITATFYAIIGLSAAINLYLAVQFESLRVMLREMIGVEAFSEIVGDNPGTAHVKVAVGGATVILAAAGGAVLIDAAVQVLAPLISSVASNSVANTELAAGIQRINTLADTSLKTGVTFSSEQYTQVLSPPVQNAAPHYPNPQREHFATNLVKVVYDSTK
jgi:hypothetical protein